MKIMIPRYHGEIHASEVMRWAPAIFLETCGIRYQMQLSQHPEISNGDTQRKKDMHTYCTSRPFKTLWKYFCYAGSAAKSTIIIVILFFSLSLKFKHNTKKILSDVISDSTPGNESCRRAHFCSVH